MTPKPEVFTTDRYMRELRQAAEVREADAYADRVAAHRGAPGARDPAPGPPRHKPAAGGR